jgi:pyruvate-ferredoxin/flavodoxin oxidoreductase
MTVDGTYPSGTTQWEKRNVSDIVAVWEPNACIQCGNCAYVCPHSVIRAKFFHKDHLKKAPDDFKSMDEDDYLDIPTFLRKNNRFK